MRKRLLTTVAAALVLALVVVPGIGVAANVSVLGIAQMNWNIPAFESDPNVSWLDPLDPTVDTRFSFAGEQLELNGVIFDDGDYIDGAPWALTGLSTTLADGTGNVYGSGNNVPNLGVQGAVSTIDLSGDSYGQVWVAQAVLGGQFTVLADMPLFSIFADYLFQMSLLNTHALYSYVDVSAGLTLSDFGTGALLAEASDFRSLSLTGNGGNSFFFDFQDPNYAGLNLAYPLVAGTVYDFEAQVSTAAYAQSVPEPLSLILLASGLGCLAIFRKRFA